VGEKSELKLENLDVKAAVLLAFLRSLGFAVALVAKVQLASVNTCIPALVGFFSLDGISADSCLLLMPLLLETPKISVFWCP
jgi:hypothetical protein